MKQIIGPNDVESALFTLQPGEEATLFAYGLQNGETVSIGLNYVTPSDLGGDLCCPAAVVLPDAIQVANLTRYASLTDATSTDYTITPAVPWMTIRQPVGVPLKAWVNPTETASGVQVFLDIHKLAGEQVWPPIPEAAA